MKKLPVLVALALLVPLILTGCTQYNNQKANVAIGMAVEFTDHAANAYIAQDKGWFREAGLNLNAYESYVTGVALAAALTRGDIQVAYICLAPAINAYANARVPIKIVAGTHKYGFGLVVNPGKIKSAQDLEKPGIRIGCVQTGAASDVFMQKVIDKYRLNRDVIVKNVQQMNPPKQLLAIKAGKLDAAFLPEQWASMAEDSGFKMLLTAKDAWPDMQGSVLIVKDDLITNHPETVKGLVNVSQKASAWSNKNPAEAASVMARQLQLQGDQVFPTDVAETTSQLEITPDLLLRSMQRLEYTTDISLAKIQETIDFIASLGYIKSAFQAENIVDMRFLK